MMLRRTWILLLPGCAALLAQTASKSDDRIYDEVRRKLASDQSVRGGALEVDVKDGTVTLRGAVREHKQKQKAEKVTKKVKGVTRVVNEITVRPAAP